VRDRQELRDEGCRGEDRHPDLGPKALCPDGLYVKRDFYWYEVLSRKMLGIVGRFSPRVEYFSVDDLNREPRGGHPMNSERLPFFLARSRDWWAAADALRAAGVPDGDPVLTIWREVAWCHVLFDRGLYPAAFASLRVAVRRVTGAYPIDPSPPPATETLSAAADPFARLRATVSARYPRVFAHPAAA
jgi:hypothetical protein